MGRIKTKLARKIKIASGVSIRSDDMETTEVSCRLAGGANWGGYGRHDGKSLWVYSFATMTLLASRSDLSVTVSGDMAEVM